MMLHFHPDDVEATMPCAIFLTFKKNKIYTLSTNVLLLSPRVPLEKCVNCVWPIYLRGMAQPRFQGSQSRAPAGVSLRPDIHVFWGRKEPESPVKKKAHKYRTWPKCLSWPVLALLLKYDPIFCTYSLLDQERTSQMDVIKLKSATFSSCN